MFSFLPLSVDEQQDDLEQILEESVIDFDVNTKDRLKETIVGIQNCEVTPVDDDYTGQS